MADLEQIFQYYRNIAERLAPPGNGLYSRFPELTMERYTYPLIRE